MKKLTLFLFCLMSVYCAFAGERQNALVVQPATSIATFLNSDGALILCKNYVGSLNLSGYDVFIDENEGVIALPFTGSGNWSTLGSGLGAACLALAADGNGNVYAGGNFTSAGGNPANKIAKC